VSHFEREGGRPPTTFGIKKHQLLYTCHKVQLS